MSTVDWALLPIRGARIVSGIIKALVVEDGCIELIIILLQLLLLFSYDVIVRGDEMVDLASLPFSVTSSSSELL